MEYGYTGRREDRRLVTGAGMFTADWGRPDVLHAAFLRADRAHARIVNCDVGAAQAAPGVRAVLTGADMQAAGYTRDLPLMPLGRGEALKAIDAPALALGCVRYVGEPVAIVVADSPHAAQDACELIRIDYASLPPVVGGSAALAQGAALLHAEIPGNLCYETDFGDRVATQAAFAAAAHVVRLEQESGRVVGNPMEPKAAMAAWDGDILELWSPSQGMTSMRDSLAALVGLTPDKLRVHAQDVGGAFGVRGAAYQEYAALALAARQIGRPVKWIASRSETFLSDYHGRAVSMVAELALDADGCFLAIRHDWICDIGAGAVHQYLQRLADGDRRLPYSGCAWAHAPRRHQHRADHRVSRRRPARHGLRGGAPGRRSGRADRHRPHRAAPPKPDPVRPIPLCHRGRSVPERL
jgi:carbon-monoxide dehydrogenase large subunit